MLESLCAQLEAQGAQCEPPKPLSKKTSALQAVDIALRHPKAPALHPHIQNWVGAAPD